MDNETYAVLNFMILDANGKPSSISMTKLEGQEISVKDLKGDPAVLAQRLSLFVELLNKAVAISETGQIDNA